jgi:chemotaxis protein MotA
MNFSTLIGFLFSFGVFFGALVMSSRNLAVFLDSHAILIVVGGTMSASFVCFSLPRVFGLLKVFAKRMLGTNKKNYLALIDEIVALSSAFRKGKQNFEQSIKTINDPFLKDAAQVLFWLDAEVSRDEMRSLLETRAETHFERYMTEADIFRVMAKFPPAFGLMGTSLGMIALLQALGRSDSKNMIGPSMAIALVATLYGIVLSNFVFTPIAENLTQQSKEDLVSRRMVVEGVMLIADNKPTLFVEEKVKSFLLPSERGADKSASGGGARKAA